MYDIYVLVTLTRFVPSLLLAFMSAVCVRGIYDSMWKLEYNCTVVYIIYVYCHWGWKDRKQSAARSAILYVYFNAVRSVILWSLLHIRASILYTAVLFCSCNSVVLMTQYSTATATAT